MKPRKPPVPSQPETRGRRLDSVALAFALIILLALGLRLYRIDAQSLWSDEGNSIALAQRSFVRIAHDSAQDIHPPLYYWTLHLWTMLAGIGVAAVRGLSAFYGTLVVVLTYVLGRRWFGISAGLLAATAAALSPLAIHYSQETRMYMLVTLLGALTWLAFLHWLERPTIRRLALYWIAGLVTISTHYFGVSLIIAVNLVWLVWFVRQRRLRRVAHAALNAPSPYAKQVLVPTQRGLRARFQKIIWREAPAWLLAQAALAAVVLPRVWHSRGTIESWGGARPDGPLFVLGDTLRAFSLGLFVQDAWLLWAVGFVLLSVLGLLARPRLKTPIDARIVVVAWLLVPLWLMVMVSLGRDYYRPRFMLLALPAFHLLIGHGAAAIGERLRAPRAIGGLAAACLILAAYVPLRTEWTDPTTWRDDYRGIAQTVATTSAPDDAILLLGAGQIETFDYYYHGALPRYPLPRTRPMDATATAGELEQIAARHRRLYAVLWGEQESDPGAVVDNWLGEHAFKTSDRWYGTVRLVQYEFGDLQDQLKPLDAQWANGIRLTRAAVSPQTVLAGDTVRVALEWQTSAAIERPLQVFAQLLDETNNIVGQYDGPPAQEPSTTWQTGRPQPGHLGIQVRAGTPPGAYRLIAGLYDDTTIQRVALASGPDALPLATIQVQRPPVPPNVDSLDLTVHSPIRTGQAEILGWRFNRLGSDQDIHAPLHAGEPLNVVLFWQASVGAPAIPDLTLQILDANEHLVAEWPWTPAGGRYRPADWQAGEVVRDPQVYFIPGDLVAGRYQLVLAEGTRRAALGEIAVE